MNFSFEQQFSASLNDKMPSFIRLQQSITIPPWDSDLILHFALHAVKYKIQAAKFHIFILNEAFTLTDGDKNFLKRTMVDNIIFNLSSLLDSAHAINQIYQANIVFKGVNMDHRGRSDVPIHKNCLRCYLMILMTDFQNI